MDADTKLELIAEIVKVDSMFPGEYERKDLSTLAIHSKDIKRLLLLLEKYTDTESFRRIVNDEYLRAFQLDWLPEAFRDSAANLLSMLLQADYPLDDLERATREFNSKYSESVQSMILHDFDTRYVRAAIMLPLDIVRFMIQFQSLFSVEYPEISKYLNNKEYFDSKMCYYPYPKNQDGLSLCEKHMSTVGKEVYSIDELGVLSVEEAVFLFLLAHYQTDDYLPEYNILGARATQIEYLTSSYLGNRAITVISDGDSILHLTKTTDKLEDSSEDRFRYPCYRICI